MIVNFEEGMNMVLLKEAAALAVLISFSVVPAAIGQRVCEGKKGAERTACLNAEVERGRAESARIERSNHRLDTAIHVVCTGRKVADVGARGARMVGGEDGRAASASWRAGKAIGHVVTGGNDRCPNE